VKRTCFLPGDFVEPTDCQEPCEDRKRLGIVLCEPMLAAPCPAAAVMVFWLCCNRQMIANAHYLKRVNPLVAQRMVREGR